MSIVCVLMLNCLAMVFASSRSFWFFVSSSGISSARIFLPPKALLHNAAVVALSIPPDSPSTMPPLLWLLDTYSLINWVILVSVSEKSTFNTEGVNFTGVHVFIFMVSRQLFKGKHKY